jgi:starch phosphorylase
LKTTALVLMLKPCAEPLPTTCFYIQGKFPEIASTNDFYLALAYTVRDRLMNRWLHSTRTYLQNDACG